MKTIFEKSQHNRKSFVLKDTDFESYTPKENDTLKRSISPQLPEVAEIDLMRHYMALSKRNRGIDDIFYPLGSCTMKYNPRINEEIASWSAFTASHPLSPDVLNQGNLQILYEAQEMLSDICGMDTFTMQPAAGAHGELTGIMLIQAYHRDKNPEQNRHKILVPDSSHGTNPASAALCGYDIISIRTDKNGGVDLEHLKQELDHNVAGLMMTNPNTIGLFETNILEISRLVHEAGALLYYDGANLNAILGKCRPGDMGFDVIHVNLHKTFSTPHGGGGPGSGAVGIKNILKPYLPTPTIVKSGSQYSVNHDHPKSIGPVMAFHGNFLVVVRAYIYMTLLGADGLKDVGENAVLNANYLMSLLKKDFHVAYDRICMHEFVLTSKWQNKFGIHTKHLAKRLIDKGYHPPTTYFPLIVEEALMIEPTETESKETLDQFAQDLIAIAREAETTPDIVLNAPHSTPVQQLDEATAARKPKLRWRPAQA